MTDRELRKMTEEDHLREMISIIQRDYQKQIKPYIDRLAKIEAMKPPKPFMIQSSPETIERLRQFIPHLPNCE